MRMSENCHIVYALKPGDHQAGVDFDSINMKYLHSVTFVIACATLTGDAVLTINSGASDGTKTTAETFRYRYADADQGSAAADNYSAWATSASLTLTAATYSDRTLIVEIDADQLTDGQPFVTGSFSAAADALNASVVALGCPRYAAHDMPSVLPAA